MGFAKVTQVVQPAGRGGPFGNVHARIVGATPPPAVSQLLRSRAGRSAITFVGSGQRISDLHQLVIESVIALAIMAVISGALG